ncbi:transglycosylase domain-containing protein [Methylobacterium crusticola]|nr:transglycosylase domain-containing protein [Methylobacterium crusticola]
MAESVTTRPGRDWLDLTTPPQAAGAPARDGAAPAWTARLALGAGSARAAAARARDGAADRLRPVVGRLAPPLRAAADAVAAHPLAAQAAGAARRVPWGRAAALLGLGLLGLAAAFLAWCAVTLPPLAGPVRPTDTIVVLAEDGEVVASRGLAPGRPLSAGAVAPIMRRALLAAQDPWFDDATRLDAAGIGGVVRDAFRGTIAPGPRSGSARLTQRLVRRDLLAGERGLAASVREAMLVLWLEGWAGREAILTRALNLARFGPGLHGIDAAARRVLGKEAGALTTADAAFLAGLTLEPADLVPDRDLEEARARGRRVLDALVMMGALSRAQADEAGRALAGLAPASATPVTRSGFPDLMAGLARERLAGAPFHETVVRTSLDRTLQGFAEKAVERRLDAVRDGAGRRRAGTRAGLVALGPDGAVLAAVGGGNPLAGTPAARTAAGASLRGLVRDGVPVDARAAAPPLGAAALRAAALSLLGTLAGPAGDARPGPAARDGLSVGTLGAVTVGVWVSTEEGRPQDGDPAEALFQDFAGQVAKARPAPPAEARETGSAGARNPGWQYPGGRGASQALRGIPRVLDTERLRLDGQTIRLVGVQGETGRLAREFRQYLRRREVACEPAGEPERYRCRAGTQDLSEVVLFNGAGRAVPGAPPELLAAEASARSRQAGVWQN